MSRINNNKDSIDQNWQNNDYEIKEQDRFLPIANGMYIVYFLLFYCPFILLTNHSFIFP